MAHRKHTSSKIQDVLPQPIDTVEPSTDEQKDDVATQFVGQWNRLVSTTNWEKGRIICEWREALMTSGAAVTEYSDEAWAQLVGGVTSQHVGRLRRVSQRFGEALDQYKGLYWSHFQAAIDWDDAEMWLEGSIQNDWSVSQMRGKRWETLGTTPEQQRAETVLDVPEVDEDSPAEEEQRSETSSVAASTAAVQSLDDEADADQEESESSSGQGMTSAGASPGTPVEKRTRLSVNVEDLPDDLAEAFEQFKLAIIAHRREGWSDTTPEAVIECLGALQELALLPTDE